MFILLYLMWYDTLSKHFSHSQFNCVDIQRKKIVELNENSLVRNSTRIVSFLFYFTFFYILHQISMNSLVTNFLLSLTHSLTRCVFSFATKEDSLVTAFVVYKSNEIKKQDTEYLHEEFMMEKWAKSLQIFSFFHKIKRFFLFIITKPPYSFLTSSDNQSRIATIFCESCKKFLSMQKWLFFIYMPVN